MTPDRPLLEVNALKKHFPIHGGLLGQETAKVYAVDGVTFDISARRDAVAGRRIRLRQIHRRQGDPAALRHHRRRGVPGRRAHRQHAGRQAAADAPARAGGVPGSVLQPQSAHAGARHPGRADPQFRPGAQSRRAERARRRADGQGAAAARRGGPLSARILRRPAPAHRHRPRAGAGRGPDHLRRGGVGAGRFGEGADHQPAGRSAGRTRAGAAVHQPRSGDRWST